MDVPGANSCRGTDLAMGIRTGSGCVGSSQLAILATLHDLIRVHQVAKQRLDMSSMPQERRICIDADRRLRTSGIGWVHGRIHRFVSLREVKVARLR